MWPNPQETADLVTFTEEILNGKLHFLCIPPSIRYKDYENYWINIFLLDYLVDKKQFSREKLMNSEKLVKGISKAVNSRLFNG